MSSEPFGRFRRFLRELKRRNVYKVAVTYVAVAFVGFQAARLLIPSTVLPAWSDEFFLFFLIVGFPVAVVVAWAFEMTPEGVRRTPRAASETSDSGGEASAVTEPEASSVSMTTGLVGLLAVLMLAAGGWWYLRPFTAGQAEAASERSIAVLPFDDLSPAGSSQHLGLGLTESIIAELALVEDLSVVSRTSVMPYRDTDLQLPAIADSLGVEHILEGSIRQHGDSVQITAQLIRADNDRHIWVKTYDRKFSDIFRVQSEVARQVADALEAELTSETQKRLRESPTENSTAYKLYLRGRNLTATAERANLSGAIELFRQAIRLDSTFALAYAGLSQAYEEYGDFGVAGKWLDSAEVAARQAVERDPNSAAAHRALGNVRYSRGRLTAAERHFKRSVALKPGDGRAFSALAAVYHWGGQIEESLRWAWRALPLLPNDDGPRVWIMQAMFAFREEAATRAWRERLREMSDNGRSNLSLFHAFARGNYGAARKRLNKLRHQKPGAAQTLQWRGVFAQLDGHTAEARSLYRRVYRERPGVGLWSVAARTRLAQTILAADGDTAHAEKLLHHVIQQFQPDIGRNETFYPRVQLAASYAVLGNKQEAYRWLDRIPVGVNRRQVPHDPAFRNLHDEERFKQWRERARRQAMKQRRMAMKWARKEGIDWPPMPEDSPAKNQ